VIRFVDLGAQVSSIKLEIEAAVERVISSGNFVLGDEVEAFESEFSSFCQVKHAVATNSGTSALHLALISMGIGAGDEVISVAHTFVATIEAISYTGARPVLVDIDLETLTINPEFIESAITNRTKALVVVHLYGQCADMDPIMDLARRRGLRVVEDAAQAHGALYKGRRAGSMGDVACFSFYPTKNLGALGEAGALVTNDDSVAQIARRLRNHGQSYKYHHDSLGYNYRMEEVQAAVLRIKLPHLDEWNNKRRRIAALYRDLLGEEAVRSVRQMSESSPVYHIFAAFHDRRDELQRYLAAHQVQTAIHYPIPVHLQAGYKHLGYRPGDLPNSEVAARDTLSLPIYPEISEENVTTVSRLVKDFR
jgi:dTDP-4-amino-4,6-dideoxygalactose transaminase